MCGRTACTVRREEGPGIQPALPTPISAEAETVDAETTDTKTTDAEDTRGDTGDTDDTGTHDDREPTTDGHAVDAKAEPTADDILDALDAEADEERDAILATGVHGDIQ